MASHNRYQKPSGTCRLIRHISIQTNYTTQVPTRTLTHPSYLTETKKKKYQITTNTCLDSAQAM